MPVEIKDIFSANIQRSREIQKNGRPDYNPWWVQEIEQYHTEQQLINLAEEVLRTAAESQAKVVGFHNNTDFEIFQIGPRTLEALEILEDFVLDNNIVYGEAKLDEAQKKIVPEGDFYIWGTSIEGLYHVYEKDSRGIFNRLIVTDPIVKPGGNALYMTVISKVGLDERFP